MYHAWSSGKDGLIWKKFQPKLIKFTNFIQFLIFLPLKIHGLPSIYIATTKIIRYLSNLVSNLKLVQALRKNMRSMRFTIAHFIALHPFS